MDPAAGPIPAEYCGGALHNSHDDFVVKPWRVISESTTTHVPPSPDKSVTHRAIMLAAMAKGTSLIHNPLTGEDCLATKKVFEACGVKVQSLLDASGVVTWRVDSPGADQFQSPAEPLDLGNSGTSARLLTGFFAGIRGLKVTLTGDDSLRRRPMGRVVEPLRNMGADIAGPDGGQTLPLTITGSALTGQTHYLRVPSAQIKSSIQLAALSTTGETVIDLPAGGRDHTEIMLKHLAALVKTRRHCDREKISITGPWRPSPFECEIPTDPSSVAFFASLAAIHAGLRVVARNVIMNPTRIGFYEKLRDMGVEVEWGRPKNAQQFLGESVADLTIYRHHDSPLKPVCVKPQDVAALIDEIPVLAMTASFADGVSSLAGLAELRVKESDRFAQILQILEKGGVHVTSGTDWLKVDGQRCRSVNAFSFGSDDHRLVMSAMIFATAARGPSRIAGLSWIRTSFPLFLEAFQNINLDIV